MRIFILSDLHADTPENVAWLRALSEEAYRADALLVPGDISDSLERLELVLTLLRARFAHLFFVPGNHELWIRYGEASDSIAKFWQILRLCATLGVQTSPARLGSKEDSHPLWILPLFSWYAKPEESPDSLFIPKEGEDPELTMWTDNYVTTWPPSVSGSIADYFLRLNAPHLNRSYDAPILSFSHFLPRTDLVFPTPEEVSRFRTPFVDPYPAFNFTRVAGTAGLERQLREVGSAIHVYGHQHRPRHRHVEGVLYLSHHLGYPRERDDDANKGVSRAPKLVWDTQQGRMVS